MTRKKTNISLRALIAGFTTILATLTIPTYSEAEVLEDINSSVYQEESLDDKQELDISKLDKINSIQESDLSFLYKISTIFDN